MCVCVCMIRMYVSVCMCVRVYVPRVNVLRDLRTNGWMIDAGLSMCPPNIRILYW